MMNLFSVTKIVPEFNRVMTILLKNILRSWAMVIDWSW